MAVFAAFVSVGGPVQLLNPATGVWFSEVVIFFGLAFVVLEALGRPPLRVTGLDSTTTTSVALGAGLGLLNYAAWAVPLMAVSQHLLPQDVIERFDGSQLFANQTSLERIVFVIGISVAAPLCEEFFFRGIVQRGLMTRLGPLTAILVTSLLFSAFHLDPVGFLARTELGVLFGVLAWKSGSLWPGIAAHAANNTVATVLFLLTRGADESELSWQLIVVLVALGNLGFFLIAALARGRLVAPRPADDEAMAPPVALWRAALPFLLGGTLVVAAVGTLDWRGGVLRAYDATHPLPKKLATAPELVGLRAKARSGEVPLEEYYEAHSLMTPPSPAQ